MVAGWARGEERRENRQRVFDMKTTDKMGGGRGARGCVLRYLAAAQRRVGVPRWEMNSWNTQALNLSCLACARLQAPLVLRCLLLARHGEGRRRFSRFLSLGLAVVVALASLGSLSATEGQEGGLMATTPPRGTLLFSTRAGASVNAPVTVNGNGSLADGRYVGQLYAGAPGTELKPIGEPVPFRSDAGRGYITAGGSVTVPDVAAGQPAQVKMVAWLRAYGATYVEAQALGVGQTGESGVIIVNTGHGSESPAPLVGLLVFQISSIAAGPDTGMPREGAPAVIWPVNQHVYQRLDAPSLSWALARHVAAGMTLNGVKGHLVTINTLEENQFLTEHPSLGNGAANLLHQYWIGAYWTRESTDLEGGWRWVTGEPFDFAHWQSTTTNSPPDSDSRGYIGTGLTSTGQPWSFCGGTPGWFMRGYIIEYGSPDDPSPATYVLTTADEEKLHLAMKTWDTIRLEFDGTIVLSRPLVVAKDLTLDATGHQVRLSGNQRVRVLEVRPEVRLTLQGVIVADGRSNRGGGLWNERGKVALLSCTFTNNQALGEDGTPGPELPAGSEALGHAAVAGGIGSPGEGGALFNSGELVASHCLFVANGARGGSGGAGGKVASTVVSGGPPGGDLTGGVQGAGGDGGSAAGGALFHESGLARFVDCAWVRNTANGGDGGNAPGCTADEFGGGGGVGGLAQGGAVFVSAGKVEWLRGRWEENRATGGRGGGVGRRSSTRTERLATIGLPGTGGNARGGALFSGAENRIEACEFQRNEVLGGAGGKGGARGIARSSVSAVTLPPPGEGAPGGRGEGGGLWSDGPLHLTANAWIDNRAEGGAGGEGGNGTEGSGSTGMPIWFSAISSPGASGGRGGPGQGGAIFLRGRTDCVNGTMAGNIALGGMGGRGGKGGVFLIRFRDTFEFGGSGGQGGDGSGGGILNVAGELSLRHVTIARNAVRGGSGGKGGAGYQSEVWSGPDGPSGEADVGGIFNLSGSVHCANSILGPSASGANLGGAFQDDGHNLSSDDSVALQGPGSRCNVDPRLGARTEHGGATTTVLLLAGSPALDTADPQSCPETDQRGQPRPLGAGCDIGALEIEAPELPELSVSTPSTTVRVGEVSVVELEIRNPSATATLSNVTFHLDLPPGLSWTAASPAAGSIWSLGPGQVHRLTVSFKVEALGDHGIALSAGSDWMGAKKVVAGTVIKGGGLPEVLTAWALWESDGTVSLEALVIPNGMPAIAWFQYGASETLGSRTDPEPAGSAFEPVPVRRRAEIGQTAVGVHYQLVISNALGVVESPIRWMPVPRTLQDLDEPGLRAAVSEGGYLRLAWDGTIRLTSPLVVSRHLVMDARGRQVTLSGEEAVRVMEVLPETELTLLDVNLTRGRHTAQGGALFNSNGVVRILGGVLSENSVASPPGLTPEQPGGDARGGAIFNHGLLFLQGLRLESNKALGGAGSNLMQSATAGGVGEGGALWHGAGLAVLSQCQMLSNQVRGGDGSNNRWNLGPAPGGSGQAGRGGAIYHAGSRLFVQESRLAWNTAAGGNAGSHGPVTTGHPGTNGTAGAASGGGIHSSGFLGVATTLFTGNATQGGMGLPPRNRSLSSGWTRSEPGEKAGDAFGGAVFSSAPTLIANTTFALNGAWFGPMGTGHLALATAPYQSTSRGGALYQSGGSLQIAHATFSQNTAESGADIASTNTTIRLANNLFESEASAPSLEGTLVDLGVNLSADTWTPFPSLYSRNGANPRLLPLADNGGPTWTLALAPDSPAIDAGADGFDLPSDQRGLPRRVGSASDLGAYEYQGAPPALSASAWLRTEDGAMVLRFVGAPNRTVILEATLDWRGWAAIQTNVMSSEGVCETCLSSPLMDAHRFFRLRMDP